MAECTLENPDCILKILQIQYSETLNSLQSYLAEANILSGMLYRNTSQMSFYTVSPPFVSSPSAGHAVNHLCTVSVVYLNLSVSEAMSGPGLVSGSVHRDASSAWLTTITYIS